MIESGQTLVDSLSPDLNRCYYYDIKQNFYLKYSNDDRIIIHITLFGGEAFLHISGFNKMVIKNLNEIKKLKKYGFQIYNEKSILITKKDLKIFENEFDSDIPGEKNNFIFFCVYGLEKGSYMINVNNLNMVTNYQKYNYIFPGQEIKCYLAEGQITSYKIIYDNKNKNSNITLIFKNIEGNCKLFGYFCDSEKDLYCSFGEYKLKNKLEGREMLLPQDDTLLEQKIFIENKNNYCYNKNKKLCFFSLTLNIANIPIIMSPRKTYSNFISKGSDTIYEIIISDPDINSLVVVLSTNIGNAELKLELQKSKDFILIKYSRNEYDIPDIIRLKPEEIKKENLIGNYLITVFTKYYSSYNLYYYTTSTKKKPDNIITQNDITSTLVEGQIIQDYFDNNINYKIYYYTPNDKSSKDIKITLTRINIRFTFYVFLDMKDIKIKNNIASVYDERISGYIWSSDANNELTISNTDKYYKRKGNYYIVVMPDYTTNIKNIDSTEYIINLMYYI